MNVAAEAIDSAVLMAMMVDFTRICVPDSFFMLIPKSSR